MKRLGPISCVSAALLLSSCSLTPVQPPLSAEEAAALKLASSELELALLKEEKLLLEEAEARAKAEAEEVIKEIIACHVAHEIHKGAAQGNIQHQIGNTFISVFITENIKLSAKFFHGCHS